MKDKKGIVPRPAPTGYRVGTVEDPHVFEGLKGTAKNKVVEIAPSPEVHDREHAKPSMGIARTKDASHGHEYPGRSYKTQTVRDAVAKPLDRKIKDKELGSNQRKGN